MTFELVGGGKLMATGTITPGISEAFAAEVKRRGDYIRTVAPNSPGGSVTDALTAPAPAPGKRDSNGASEWGTMSPRQRYPRSLENLPCASFWE